MYKLKSLTDNEVLSMTDEYSEQPIDLMIFLTINKKSFGSKVEFKDYKLFKDQLFFIMDSWYKSLNNIAYEEINSG